MPATPATCPSVAFLVLATLLPAQAKVEPAVLRQRLEDKLAAPFLHLAPWHTDLAAAQQAAAREGKLILAHCTRSFMPCGTSIRCEREVLGAPEFATLAARTVLYCHVTAHLDAERDRFLFATRGSGWPHHVVLDATGRVLGIHESHRDKSVSELSRLLDRAQDFLRIEAETEKDMAEACRRRLRAGLEAGALDLAEARRLLARSGPLERAEAERLAGLITDLEVADVASRHDRFAEGVPPVVGGEFLAMWRMGKRPTGRNAARDFWGGILLHLETQERPDLELCRQALDELERRFGEARGYRAFLDARRKALEGLQSRPASAPASAPAPRR